MKEKNHYAFKTDLYSHCRPTCWHFRVTICKGTWNSGYTGTDTLRNNNKAIKKKHKIYGSEWFLKLL